MEQETDNRLSIQRWWQSLSEVDLQFPDVRQAGSWSGRAKASFWSVTALCCLLTGYSLYITPQLRLLQAAVDEEQHLLNIYTEKVQQKADLPVYRQQMTQIQLQTQNLLRQLPSDRAAPELVEQISDQARAHNIDLQELKLQPETQHKSYTLQPILITASGGYHNLARFITGLTQMERLVTVHDFTLTPAAYQLRLSLKAAAYYDPTLRSYTSESHPP